MSIGAGRGHKHKDPHAHTIHQPGARLLRGVKLHFVYKKVAGHGARSVNESLNLIPFIDFLLVTVIFLLMSFSASGEITVELPAFKEAGGTSAGTARLIFAGKKRAYPRRLLRSNTIRTGRPISHCFTMWMGRSDIFWRRTDSKWAMSCSRDQQPK